MLRKTVWPLWIPRRGTETALGVRERPRLLSARCVSGKLLRAGLVPSCARKTLPYFCFVSALALSFLKLPWFFSLHFLPFSPQSLPLTPCVLPSLGYKAILILKLHIGDQTSKTILFLCLLGLDCWPHGFHFYSFGSNIHLLHCTLYFCCKIFCFCFCFAFWVHLLSLNWNLTETSCCASWERFFLTCVEDVSILFLRSYLNCHFLSLF